MIAEALEKARKVCGDIYEVQKAALKDKYPQMGNNE